MLKRNPFFIKAANILLLLFRLLKYFSLACFGVIFIGCTTIPKPTEDIEVFSLFTEDADCYISVPVKKNRFLIEGILYRNAYRSAQKEESSRSVEENAFIAYESVKGLAPLLDRADNFYASIVLPTSKKERMQYHCAVTGDIPSFIAGFVFSEKNGFEKRETSEKYSSYWFHKENKIEVAFPYDNFIIAGTEDVASMKLKLLEPSLLFTSWNDSIKLFMDDRDSIRMYIKNASACVPKILGIPKVTLGAQSALLSLEKRDKERYEVLLDLTMNSSRSKKMGMILLKIAGNGKRFVAVEHGENSISISQYYITEDELAKLIVE